MPQFEMTVEPFGTGVCVSLVGELDLLCAYTFDARLREVEERDPRLVVLDLEHLRFLDSAGVGRILAAHNRSRRAGRRLVLTRGGRTVRRVLAMAALEHVIEIVSEPEAALT